MFSSLNEAVRVENDLDFKLALLIISSVFLSKDCNDNVTALSSPTDRSSLASGIIFSEEIFAQFV